MANFTIELRIPELAELAKALLRMRTPPATDTPKPSTPAQSAQPVHPASAPVQAAPAAAPTAPISPTRAYSTAPQSPQAPVYQPQQTGPSTNPTPVAPAAPTYPNPMTGAVNMAPAAAHAPSQPALIAPSTNPTPQPAAPVAAAPSYSLEQIARAAGAVADAGKRQEVCDLITKTFGVATLSQIPKDKYGAFATALRGMGARI